MLKPLLEFNIFGSKVNIYAKDILINAICNDCRIVPLKHDSRTGKNKI